MTFQIWCTLGYMKNWLQTAESIYLLAESNVWQSRYLGGHLVAIVVLGILIQ